MRLLSLPWTFSYLMYDVLPGNKAIALRYIKGNCFFLLQVNQLANAGVCHINYDK